MEEITIIDRKLVTQATQLDVMMDECTDEDTYKSLKKKYRQLLYPYCLWVATFVEDREQSELGWEDIEDFTKHIYEENGKFGVKKTNLYIGFPAVYDKIEVTGVYFGATLVYKDGKMGLIEVQPGETNMVFDTVYDDIKIIRYKQFVLKKDDKYIYWHNGKASEPFDNIHVPWFAGWITVCQEGTWGWLDGDLRFTTNLLDAHEYTLDDVKPRLGEFHDVSKEKLNKCSEFDNELTACQEADRSEAEKAAEQYSAFICDNKEKTVFCKNGKYGIKDFLDYAIVPPEYDEVILENQFTAYGRKQNLWGLILYKGNSITNPRIEFDKPPMSRVYGNWQEVQVKGKWGLYDPGKDEYILKTVYDDLHVQNGHYHIILKKDNKYGYYDNQFFVPCGYDDIWWGRGLSFVKFKKDGKWGYMDADTHWVEDIGKARVIAVNPMWDEQNI